MATRLKETDVVMLGVGLVGSIVGRELTKAGLEVVGLERGEPRFTVPDFQAPAMHDELRYSIRKSLMMDAAKETYTFRNSASETALPMRRIQGFLPGAGLGGSAVHWNGQTGSTMPTSACARSQRSATARTSLVPSTRSRTGA